MCVYVCVYTKRNSQFCTYGIHSYGMLNSSSCRHLLRVHRSLLRIHVSSVCRAILSVYRALLSVYRALLSVYRHLLRVHRALVRIHVALLFICMYVYAGLFYVCIDVYIRFLHVCICMYLRLFSVCMYMYAGLFSVRRKCAEKRKRTRVLEKGYGRMNDYLRESARSRVRESMRVYERERLQRGLLGIYKYVFGSVCVCVSKCVLMFLRVFLHVRF